MFAKVLHRFFALAAVVGAVLLLMPTGTASAVDQDIFIRYADGSVTCKNGKIQELNWFTEVGNDMKGVSGQNEIRYDGQTEFYEFLYSANPYSGGGDGGTTFVSSGPYGVPIEYTQIERTFVDGDVNSTTRISASCAGRPDGKYNAETSFRFADERANIIDNAAPATVYLPGAGGNEDFRVWRKGDGDSYYKALSVSPDEIDAVPESPEENTEVASTDDNYLRFFRLTTGEIQLNVGPDEEGKVHVYVMNPDTFGLNRSYTFTVD